MAFDPSTASPVVSGFDPSTARVDDAAPTRVAVASEPSPYSAFIPDLDRPETPEESRFRAIGEAAGARNEQERQRALLAVERYTDIIGDRPSLYKPTKLGLATLRIAPPLAVGVGTGGLGLLPALALTGVAGGLGETAAQGLEIKGGERQELAPTEIIASGALSSVPGIPLGRIASPWARAGIRVGEGAVLGGAYPVLEAGLRGEAASPEEVLQGAAFGGLVGVPFGGIEAVQAARQLRSSARPSVMKSTDVLPSELIPVGQAMREPLRVPEPSLPSPTMTVPSELAPVAAARAEAGAEIAASAAQRAALESAESQARIRALGERMMGKTPQDQLQILDQEMRLQKDYLNEAEQRAGLDLKQELKRQIDAQKAMEEAATAQAKAAPDQEKAVADAQKAIEDAQRPPEMPESARILSEPITKTPSIANVATEVATQTKNSPYALQERLNQMTTPAAAEVAGGVPPIEAAVSPQKTQAIQQAVANPLTKWQYTVFRPGEGYPSAIQVDAIEGTANTVSSNVADLNAAGANLPEVPDWVPQGQYSVEEIRAFIKQGEPKNAIREQEATGGVLRAEAQQPELDVGLQGMVRQNGPETPPRDLVRQGPVQEPRSAEQRLNDAGIGLPPISSLSAKQKLAELQAGGVTAYKGKPIEDANPAQLSAALGQYRRGQLGSERGSIPMGVLTPIAGGGFGAGYGIMQGETPEERMTNALLYGSLGTGAGVAASAASARILKKPLRDYKSSTLKRVDQMLTAKDEKRPLFEQLHDGYNNFRYRFNTRFAPIGAAQRELFKASGREFTPNKYYDLERGFERLSGAPVQAEGEVELLQNVVDALSPKEAPHLDTYLALERIKDRLLKTDEENAVLQDAVGVASAEYQAALTKAQASPTERNLTSANLRKQEWQAALENLNKNFNRKRVADWSIADAEKGLKDLEAELGGASFAKLAQAGQEYQKVMRRALDIQVESGRMTPELRDQVVSSNDFYAPFKVLRHFEEDEPFIKGGGRGRIPSSEQLVKRITGIDDNDVRIGSPTSVAAEQVYKGYILAQKNRKIRELATLSRLDPDGDFVRPMKPDDEARTGYEAVTYFVGGQPRRIEVSKDIANALNGAGVQETALVMRGLGAAGSVFKMGATGLSVPFNIANAAVFDPLRLATISKYGFRGPQDFLYTLYEWPRAFWSSLRGNVGQAMGASPDALYDQWVRSGAANSTLARAMSPEAFSSRLPLLKKGVKELYGEATYGLGAPIRVASLLSNTLEETTKLLGLQRAMRIERLDKLSPDMRRKKWDEIVTELRNYAGSPDFSRMGVDMRGLNVVIPFLNPRWQGALADFARINPFRHGNAKDAGAAWARLATLVAIPTTALTVYNLREENEADYNQIPKDDKERYFHIPLYADPKGEPSLVNYGKGGYYFKNKDGVNIRGYFRIPKREVSGLIANTFEDFVSYAKANDPKAFDEIALDFGERLFSTASPISFQGDTLDERLSSAAAGVNPVLRLPTEIAANRNFFTGREIVPKSMQEASPEKQFTEQTPEFYKRLAETIPDAAPEMMRSPLRLQHGIEGMTGGFARQFAVPRLSEGNPALETNPLLGRFFRSERIENSELIEGANEAMRARADQRLDAQRMATQIVGELEALPENQRAAAFARYAAAGTFNDEEVRKQFEDEIKDVAKGLTYEDRVVKRGYPIAGGYRARYYLDKIASLPVGQRNQYFMDQVNKGLLTEEVGKQMVGSFVDAGTPK